MTPRRWRAGSVARRAEQLGGAVGVRAASLSIDFVDPSRFALFTGARRDCRRCRRRRRRRRAIPSCQRRGRCSPRPARAAPALSAEEWSLVATFPSAATAVQLAAARQSQAWRRRGADGASGRRLRCCEPTRGRARGRAARAARGAQYVMPSVAPAEPQSRLPGGRMPRGSFTWPKLAESSPARAEWTTPAGGGARRAREAGAAGHAAVGLAARRSRRSSPSLAASAGVDRRRRADRGGARAATRARRRTRRRLEARAAAAAGAARGARSRRARRRRRVARRRR